MSQTLEVNAPPARRRSFLARWRWLALSVAAVILVAGSYAYRQHHRYKHFAVHVPGKVYRSAWVDADVFGELVPRYGVKTVVNLCYPGEMGDRNSAQRRAVEGAGATLIDLPFPPNNTWDVNYPSVAEMERILDDPASYPVWIHCQHGRERTVKALAMYDIRERHLSAQDSLQQMPLFGMEHPWHVVVFAHNYESLHQERSTAAKKPVIQPERR
jgi:hypothetical protein